MSLGSSPYGVNCLQTVHPEYDTLAPKECQVYADQLKRHYKTKTGKDLPCELVVKSLPHDFCNYYEVHAEFDDNNEEQVEAAYWLESHLPESWDKVAIQERPLPRLNF